MAATSRIFDSKRERFSKPLVLKNQVLSVTYADYFSGSTPYREIAHGPSAPYNHDTLVVLLGRCARCREACIGNVSRRFHCPRSMGQFRRSKP
jgi:hypothetical protein